MGEYPVSLLGGYLPIWNQAGIAHPTGEKREESMPEILVLYTLSSWVIWNSGLGSLTSPLDWNLWAENGQPLSMEKALLDYICSFKYFLFLIREVVMAIL